MSTIKRAPRRSRLATRLRYRHPRMADVIESPWWDWGHKVMALVGHDFCGNWSEPEPPTWWYRQDGYRRPMWRTGYPRRRFQVVTDYAEFSRLTEGLNEDDLYEWKAINASQDGELQIGHLYWGGRFYGMPKDETRILRRYLRNWRRLDWWGLRSWLYSQALHAAVHRKRPLRCHVTPPKGSGGYDHWHCDAKRRHSGPHVFGHYRWAEGDARVTHCPPGGAS